MLNEKLDSLKKGISEKKSAVIAFSGGVDSATLASIAKQLLGENSIAVTVKLHSFPERELECAKRVAGEIGIEHRIVFFDELDLPEVAGNSSERCYYCKKEILNILDSVRKELGFNVIIEGSNASDLNSYRPGRQAIEEVGSIVYSPFIEYGVNKDEIRKMAEYLGLSVSHKFPSPCLASRFPYGDALTGEAIKKVELAEDHLLDLGFRELRVRAHNDIARIEIAPDEMQLLLNMRKAVSSYLKELGFNYVTLDLEGFRSGSMDEVL